MGEQAQYLYDVFVSYSHVDRTWVHSELLSKLEAAGLKVCIDERDFTIGVPSLINMEQAVDNSRHTLAVLTPAWVNSQWTEFESLLVGTADPTGRRQKLLPLLLESCTLPARIAMLTYTDFTRLEDRAHQLHRLLQQLSGVSTAKPPQAGEPPAFVVGPPVPHPRLFFGRTRELTRLFNLWKHTPLQNAAIIGPRRSGKTSLLLHLKHLATAPPSELRPSQRGEGLPQPECYRWVFVDFQDPRMDTRAGLLRHLLESLQFPTPTPCDLDQFMNVMSHRLRTPTIILFDEIGVALQRYPELDDEFWEGLHALATNQVDGNLAFVIAAHEPPGQLVHHTGHSSPFFNIFAYTAALGPLREPEARELMESAPIPFSAAEVKWIVGQSQCWPILLQILCRERLIALESGENDDAWQEEGLRQIAPFRHLLEKP